MMRCCSLENYEGEQSLSEFSSSSPDEESLDPSEPSDESEPPVLSELSESLSESSEP